MNRLWLTVVAVAVCLASANCHRPLKYKARMQQSARSNDIYPFQNVSLDWSTRVDDLVSRLTLDEVIGQLSRGGAGTNGPAPAISRLGIGPFQWNNECLRGYVESGPATSFPDAINLAATFDKTIVYRVAEAGASEARAKSAAYAKAGQHGDHTGLDCFSPVINIMAHPLWGRTHETYGEDPSLTAQLAEAFVHGLMGNDSRYIRANSVCKHFAAYNGPENLPQVRFAFSAVVPEVDMRMTFLPQFEACVKAGAQGVMCSYNAVNGIPACAHTWLLTKVLRQEWNFSGFVVSDEGAVQMSMTEHHYFNTTLQTAVGTIQSGVNLELSWSGPPPIWSLLTQAVQQGLLDKALLYERVWPLFYTRMRLGEFDPDEMNPYTKYNLSMIQSPSQKNLSLLAAKKSLVMLKTCATLPLKNKLRTLTLIGPFANTTDQFFGDYSPTPDIHNTTNVVEGMRMLVNDPANVNMVPACSNPTCSNYDSAQRALVLAAVKKESNLIVLALGTGQQNEMEGNDRSTFELPGAQPSILADVLSVADSTNVPVVLLLFSASSANISLAVNSKAVCAVFQCGFPAQETGLALAHVLSLVDDDSNPAGRLPYTWYRDASQLPVMTDYDMRNKTYRFLAPQTTPLFDFGFGLSYSSFQYSFAKQHTSSPFAFYIRAGDAPYENRTLNVSVSNAGPYNGDAVVQLYVRWPDQVYSDPQFTRVPRLQLLAFERVRVQTGTSRLVPMLVDTKWLRLWSNGQYVVPAGSYTVFVGGTQPAPSDWHSAAAVRFQVRSREEAPDFRELQDTLADVLLRGAPL